MKPENIFYIYVSLPHVKGHIDRHLLGKIALDENGMEILEDHGLPKGLSAMSPGEAAKTIERFTTSMYYSVVNLEDIVNGLHPELIQDAKQSIDKDLAGLVQGGVGAKGSEPQSSEFEFDRIGGEGPRTLSVSDGQVFLDNQLLTQDEIDKVKDHVRTQKAFLRRKVSKAESIFQNPMDRHMLEDSAVPGVGNLRAYNQHIASGAPGIHMHFNVHGLDHLNSLGRSYGDGAIKAVGMGLAQVAKELIGKNAKIFRLGGDRFAAHVPTTEGAALLARGLRQRLESIPPILGKHNLAVSVGIGSSKDHAQWAMHDAHAERNRRGYPAGQTKTHAAVRVENGLNGLIPG